MTVVAHEVVQDVKATHLEGTLFQVAVVEAGQDWVIRDINGDLVLHDRGVMRVSLVFDTLGDDMPGGEVVELLSDEPRGPHPSLDEEEFCAIVHDTIG